MVVQTLQGRGSHDGTRGPCDVDDGTHEFHGSINEREEKIDESLHKMNFGVTGDPVNTTVDEFCSG